MGKKFYNMNNLLKALKGINKFGLALVLAAVTLLVTQSAFTNKRANLYGKYDNGATVQWIALDNLNLYGNPSGPIPSGMYRCDDEPSEICTAEFDEQPEDDAEPTGDTSPGVFDYTP